MDPIVGQLLSPRYDLGTVALSYVISFFGSLLALLLLARGRPVSTECLIEDIWDGRRPDTAHKIVQLHKGTVVVDSVLGSGTTFMITIPKGDARA